MKIFSGPVTTIKLWSLVILVTCATTAPAAVQLQPTVASSVDLSNIDPPPAAAAALASSTAASRTLEAVRSTAKSPRNQQIVLATLIDPEEQHIDSYSPLGAAGRQVSPVEPVVSRTTSAAFDEYHVTPLPGLAASAHQVLPQDAMAKRGESIKSLKEPVISSIGTIIEPISDPKGEKISTIISPMGQSGPILSGIVSTISIAPQFITTVTNICLSTAAEYIITTIYELETISTSIVRDPEATLSLPQTPCSRSKSTMTILEESTRHRHHHSPSATSTSQSLVHQVQAREQGLPGPQPQQGPGDNQEDFAAASTTTASNSTITTTTFTATMKGTIYVPLPGTTPSYGAPPTGQPAASPAPPPGGAPAAQTAAATSTPTPGMGYYVNLGLGGGPSQGVAQPAPGGTLKYIDQVPVNIEGNSVVIGSATYALDGSAPQIVNVNGNIFTVLPSEQGIVVPGGSTMPADVAEPAVTLAGLPISGDASDPDLLWIAGSAVTLPVAGSTTVAIDGETYTIGPSGIVADGVTMLLPTPTPAVPGLGIGSAWVDGTIDGVPFELAQTAAIVAGSTFAIGAGAPAVTLTADGETVSIGTEGIAFPQTTVPPLPTGMFVPDGMTVTLYTNGALLALAASSIIVNGVTYGFNSTTSIGIGDGEASLDIGPSGVVMFETLMAVPQSAEAKELSAASLVSSVSFEAESARVTQTSTSSPNAALARSVPTQGAVAGCLFLAGIFF